MARAPRYIYQRAGGPLIHWNRGRAPAQARAADAKSLGSYEPAPARAGAPEAIGDTAMQTVAAANDAVHSSTGRKVVSAASLFHGYKRTGSIGIALLYAAAGYVFPVATPVVAVAQGFAQKKGS